MLKLVLSPGFRVLSRHEQEWMVLCMSVQLWWGFTLCVSEGPVIPFGNRAVPFCRQLQICLVCSLPWPFLFFSSLSPQFGCSLLSNPCKRNELSDKEIYSFCSAAGSCLTGEPTLRIYIEVLIMWVHERSAFSQISVSQCFWLEKRPASIIYRAGAEKAKKQNKKLLKNYFSL